MLVLTENCNLSCTYCYECNDNNVMAFDSAAKIIDCEINSSDDCYKIFFFGGEPFVNFKILKRIFEYAEEHYSRRIKKYAITTNGTLVHGEIKKWLYKQKDRFEITLSLDGTREMHDKNRIDKFGRGSFDMIDLKFFTDTWSGCVAKMTISPDSLCNFADGIKYIEGLGFLCKANFASRVDYHLNENIAIIKNNFEELIEYYSQNNKPLCYMLDLPLTSVLVPLDDKFRYCGAGVERHCYGGGDKEWYPCQGLMPMSIEGRITKFKYETFSEKKLSEMTSCKGCKFIRICRTCYAMNYSATKNVFIPDPQMCTLNKICMLVSARIQYNRMKIEKIRNGQLENAIYIIAQNLNGIWSNYN